MKLSVQQMSGAVATMEASPDMTIGDFKRQLQELQEDESMKEVTIVEVLMGERKLADNEETLTQAGLSPDVVLQVVFTVRSAECSTARDAYCPRLRPFVLEPSVVESFGWPLDRWSQLRYFEQHPQVQAMEQLFNSSEGFRPIAVRCSPRAGGFRGKPRFGAPVRRWLHSAEKKLHEQELDEQLLEGPCPTVSALPQRRSGAAPSASHARALGARFAEELFHPRRAAVLSSQNKADLASVIGETTCVQTTQKLRQDCCVPWHRLCKWLALVFGCVVASSFGDPPRSLFEKLYSELSPWSASPYRRSRHPACVDEQILLRSPTYRQIVAELRRIFGVTVGYSIVNLYADGNDWTEYHRDPGSLEDLTQLIERRFAQQAELLSRGRTVPETFPRGATPTTPTSEPISPNLRVSFSALPPESNVLNAESEKSDKSEKEQAAPEAALRPSPSALGVHRTFRNSSSSARTSNRSMRSSGRTQGSFRSQSSFLSTWSEAAPARCAPPIHRGRRDRAAELTGYGAAAASDSNHGGADRELEPRDLCPYADGLLSHRSLGY
eukprot:g19894.t1